MGLLYNTHVAASPRFIRPCRPISAKTVPAGDAWLHEPKLDGYRLQIVKSGRAVRLYSRNGHEWTERLATVADALAGLACRSAVIDAELCFLTGIGAPDFAGLQLALRSRQHHKLTIFAFDLLAQGRRRPVPAAAQPAQGSARHPAAPVQGRLPAAGRDLPRWRQASSLGRAAAARGDRVEAACCALPFGRVSRLAQGQDCGLARGEPGAVADV